MELKFKLGVEFEEKTPDGREVTAIVTKEGDNFISIQTAKKEGEKSTKITREFVGDEVIVISQCIGSDLICTQKFKKQAWKATKRPKCFEFAALYNFFFVSSFIICQKNKSFELMILFFLRQWNIYNSNAQISCYFF